MNEIQQATYFIGMLIAVHAVAALYFARREKKNGKLARKPIVLMAGNCLLLLLFYVPSQFIPKSYVPILFLGFAIGFAALLRYHRNLPSE